MRTTSTDPFTSKVVRTPPAKQTNVALLILRIAVGAVFIYHGAGILFGVLGGPGLSKFAAGSHMPLFIAFLVGLAQFAGGLAVLTGVLTRLGAGCIAIVMLGAIKLTHWKNGFSITHGGYEYALTQFLVAVALMITGAGAYSLVSLMPRRRR